MSDKIILNSYAKLNLYLAVINKRKDNYHNIETVFERIDLFDKIKLTTRRDGKITVSCKDPRVPSGPANICYKSAELLRRRAGLSLGADIHIEKNIPVAAGLGGGSSNAATTLTGLNKLWKTGFSQKALCRLSSEIGSDVPFFIYDARFACAIGRGEWIKPVARLKKARLWHVLAVPRFGVSTPLIYKEWDGHKKAEKGRLTKTASDVNILYSAIIEKRLNHSPELLFNGLEEAAVRLYPEVKRIRERLADLGVTATLMSGSGPAVFGIVSARGEGLSLARRLKKQDPSLRVFIAATW